MIFVRIGIGVLFLLTVFMNLIKVLVSHKEHGNTTKTVVKTAFYIVALALAIIGLVHIVTQYQG